MNETSWEYVIFFTIWFLLPFIGARIAQVNIDQAGFICVFIFALIAAGLSL